MGILGMERPLYLSIFDLQRRTLRRYTGREAWDLSQEHEGIDALENSQDPSTHLWTIVMSGVMAWSASTLLVRIGADLGALVANRKQRGGR
jgi:hypothetical protein